VPASLLQVLVFFVMVMFCCELGLHAFQFVIAWWPCGTKWHILFLKCVPGTYTNLYT